MNMRNSSFTTELIRSLAILVGTYAVAFVAVQGSQKIAPDTLLADAGLFSACVVGVVAALIFRARPAAYLIAIFAASLSSELVMHSIYGIRSVQSAPVHFAVMLAAALGIGLGACIRKPPAVRMENQTSTDDATAVAR